MRFLVADFCSWLKAILETRKLHSTVGGSGGVTESQIIDAKLEQRCYTNSVIYGHVW